VAKYGYIKDHLSKKKRIEERGTEEGEKQSGWPKKIN